jgi:hypothetical protein
MLPDGAFAGFQLAGLGEDVPAQCGRFGSLESGVHDDRRTLAHGLVVDGSTVWSGRGVVAFGDLGAVALF